MRLRLPQEMLQRLHRRAPLAQHVARRTGRQRQARLGCPGRGTCVPPCIAQQRRGSKALALAGSPVGHQRRHRLGDGQRLLRGLQQASAALADVVGVFLVAAAAQGPMQLAQHHVGEPDHGVERSAQLVAHLRHQLAQTTRRDGAGLTALAPDAVTARQRQQRGRRPGRHQERKVPCRKAGDRIAGGCGRGVPGRRQDDAKTGQVEKRRRSPKVRSSAMGQPQPAPQARQRSIDIPRRCRPAHERSLQRTG